MKKDGKIFVYIDSTQAKVHHPSSPVQTQATNDYKHLENKILESKDEQIHLLKKTIKRPNTTIWIEPVATIFQSTYIG